MGVLHSFAWNYVKYTNMEGFRRASNYHMQCTSTMLHTLSESVGNFICTPLAIAILYVLESKINSI